MQDFFDDLASHRGVLDALVDQVDNATLEAFREPHTRLNNLTQLLQDKAAIQADKMETLLVDWEELAEELADLQAWFSRICRSLPVCKFLLLMLNSKTNSDGTEKNIILSISPKLTIFFNLPVLTNRTFRENITSLNHVIDIHIR